MPDDIHSETYPDAPVRFIRTDDPNGSPEKGVGLCLSGGGYRAMLFHVGAILRLNEAGILKDIARISSVSGGSITAGVLGYRWKKLTFGPSKVASNLNAEFVAPVRELASHTIDTTSIFGGILTPGSIADKVAQAYDKRLFKGATLQDLPSDAEGPRFVINATNVQSGVLWRFSKPYMADYLVGQVLGPKVPLAVAVAASSAFPPFLSPVELDLNHSDFKPDSSCPLQKKPYTTQVVLSDGGVYDNLGLETVWKRYDTVLVSDGGGKMAAEEEPKRDWGRHAIRVLDVIDNQVRCLRKRQLLDSYKLTTGPMKRSGAYWGIHTEISGYNLPDALPCPEDRTEELANTPTRLKRLEPLHQERLINWGYAVCDAAIRRYYNPNSVGKGQFPYPDTGV